MTFAFTAGGFEVKFAKTASDLTACQVLRHRCFFDALGLDADEFDENCEHLMVYRDGHLVATARLMHFMSGASVQRSYSAHAYDLGALEGYSSPMLEIGRFCVCSSTNSADILRVCWSAFARYVDQIGAKLIFGCASFEGIEPERFRSGFELLRRRYLAPKQFRPKQLASEVNVFAPVHGFDRRLAIQQLPPLLRSYLAMGGWVSDHAVVDRHLNTLHVFTGLEVSAIPPARVRAVRSLTAETA